MILTPRRLQELRLAMRMAKMRKQATFDFYGHELTLEYAKYLVQYLEMRFTQEEAKSN